MITLTALLNVLVILSVCPSTWPLTKEQMESCGVSCCLQKSSGSTRSIKDTKAGIISSLRCTMEILKTKEHTSKSFNKGTAIVGTLDTVTF